MDSTTEGSVKKQSRTLSCRSTVKAWTDFFVNTTQSKVVLVYGSEK